MDLRGVELLRSAGLVEWCMRGLPKWLNVFWEGCSRRPPLMQTQTPLVLPRRLGLRSAHQPGGCCCIQLLPRHSWWASWPARLLGMWAAALAWDQQLHRSSGAHGGLGTASRWGAAGLHFSVTASAWRAGPAVAGAIAAAGFGAFIGGGVNDPGLEPRSMPRCPSRLCCDE